MMQHQFRANQLCKPLSVQVALFQARLEPELSQYVWASYHDRTSKENAAYNFIHLFSGSPSLQFQTASARHRHGNGSPYLWKWQLREELCEVKNPYCPGPSLLLKLPVQNLKFGCMFPSKVQKYHLQMVMYIHNVGVSEFVEVGVAAGTNCLQSKTVLLYFALRWIFRGEQG